MSHTALGRLIELYRRSPLHPHLSRPLARSLALVRRLTGPSVSVVEREGFRMRMERDQFIDAQILLEGTWEPDTTRLLQRSVPRGGVCIDVGAHIGWTALVMAKAAGPAGSVLAFEPSPWAYERLVTNIALNPLLAPIDARCAAVGGRDAQGASLTLPRGFRLDGTDTSARCIVDVVALDSLLVEFSRVDLIKIDTDGHELEVLDGAHNLVARHSPKVVFELSPRHLRAEGRSPEELLGWFVCRHYRFEDEFSPGRVRSADELLGQLSKMRDFNVLAYPS